MVIFNRVCEWGSTNEERKIMDRKMDGKKSRWTEKMDEKKSDHGQIQLSLPVSSLQMKRRKKWTETNGWKKKSRWTETNG
jgi:hypothetical protein